MNQIDKRFYELLNLMETLSEYELYYRIRTNYQNINEETKKSMSTFFNDFPYWGKIEENNYEEIELKVKELKKHAKDFLDVYDYLEDYRSKKVLYATLNNWVNYDFKTLNEVIDNCYDDYFDLDLIPVCKNETLIDLGAYTGDTILSFIKNYGIDSYDKIIAYEITEETYQLLLKNTEEYQNIICKLKGVGNTSLIASLKKSNVNASANRIKTNDVGSIPVVTLDEDIKEKITIIKADIEGMEQDAIKGAIPVVIGKILTPYTNDKIGIIAVCCAVFVIIGHSKPIFLQFKGGKSVASGVGTILALNPFVGISIAIIWGIITYISKYVSLGSIIALILSPILMYLFKNPLCYIIYCAIAAIYIVYLHRENIKRLVKGEENKVR